MRLNRMRTTRAGSTLAQSLAGRAGLCAAVLSVCVLRPGLAASDAPGTPAASTPASVTAGCQPGGSACPIALRMARAATSVTVQGELTGQRREVYYSFAARAGQSLVISVAGDVIKTAAGVALIGPDGAEDAADTDTPVALALSGRYCLRLVANTMREDPSGRFQLTISIR